MTAHKAKCSADRRRLLTPRLVVLALCLSLLASLPGCGGCSCRKKPKTQAELDREKAEAERRARLEREKKKPPLEVDWLVSQPHTAKAKTCWVKPGHWTAATLPAKANHDDILADLEIAVTDTQGRPVGLPGIPYTLSTSRTIALPKKQPKQFDARLFLPVGPDKARASVRITSRQGGRRFEAPFQPLMPMPPHQYYCVVLARWPERYTYLEKLETFTAPAGLGFDLGERQYYRVELLRAEKETTLPGHALFWTSIASILWDDAEPDALTPEQQTALVDWLHWGGQLIISGPESLDALNHSFLAPYLPGTSSAARQITAEDLAEINRRWTMPLAGQSSPALKPAGAWPGVRLQPHSGARGVPGTGEMLLERRVGRGRVVVSAFAFSGRELVGWPGLDGFFNSALLGHPPRSFHDVEGETRITWATANPNQFGPAVHDARRLCDLRYFTRDTGRRVVVTVRPQESFLDEQDPRNTVMDTDVASWDDYNEVANAARESLQQAARIEIPGRPFVLWILAAYLLVLVPLNWLVFRALGRVEWAWAAAPLIAIGCTAVVIRMAQLDIGFARSTTQIAVVELQGDYPRAHVTRYLAMYTSLSTAYAFHFDEPGGLVLPLPTTAERDATEVRFGRSALRYRYGRDIGLEGFHILSNSTGLAHSEQMLDLGGGISLRQATDGGYELFNGSDLALRGAGVLRKGNPRDDGGSSDNHLYLCWLGDVDPGAAPRLHFRLHAPGAKTPLWPERNDRPETAETSPTGALSLRRLVALAEKAEDMRTGDVRLVAWTDRPLAGIEIRPAAPQARQVALVVAHLRYEHLSDPRPDANSRADVDARYRRVLLSE
ncbi:MAG: hypothetical protein HUU20_00895 [Pirellulales bacterium]|nr:hypothetical protein [Pirellulales bacterium]